VERRIASPINAALKLCLKMDSSLIGVDGDSEISVH